jgi:hypothetical protein
VLFDGKDLSQWVGRARDGVSGEKWRVEMVAHAGSIATREKFGDCQLHVEWTTVAPADPARRGQGRGNSGVVLMEPPGQAKADVGLLKFEFSDKGR